jgi:hypothetical protein
MVVIRRGDIQATWYYIRRDHREWPFRFYVEVLAWMFSIGCAITMAITVPTPPWIALYVFWITGCLMYAWAAYTRGSFGMLANYLGMTLIDSVALSRLLLA